MTSYVSRKKIKLNDYFNLPGLEIMRFANCIFTRFRSTSLTDGFICVFAADAMREITKPH